MADWKCGICGSDSKGCYCDTGVKEARIALLTSQVESAHTQIAEMNEERIKHIERVAEMESEHAIWEKHGFTQIVEENARLREALKTIRANCSCEGADEPCANCERADEALETRDPRQACAIPETKSGKT